MALRLFPLARYSFFQKYWDFSGRDSSVGIATRYGMDSPKIESPVGGKNFLTRPGQPWCPSSLPYERYHVSFEGVKRPELVADHQTESSEEVEERV